MVENQNLIPPWLQADTLLPFLESLREDGYRIDARRHIAVQDLLLLLAAQSKLPESPEQAASLLAPLLCSTPKEQREFPQRWLDFTGHQQTIFDDRLRRAQLRQELKAIEQRRWQFKMAGIALSVGLVIYFLVDAISNLHSIPLPNEPTLEDATGLLAMLQIIWQFVLAQRNPENADDSVNHFTWSDYSPLLLLPLLFLCVQLWLEISARRFLQRRAVQDEPDICKVSVGASLDAQFGNRELTLAAREMRRRILWPSNRLDPQATAEATACAGGWPQPVYMQQKVMPEYLALIERQDFADFQAGYADALLDRLAARQVHIDRYYFANDPRLCASSNPNYPSLSLSELSARYPQHRLLVFSSGDVFFNAATGKAQPWLERFLAWQQRLLLTLDGDLLLLSQHGKSGLTKYFQILPAISESLAQPISPLNNSLRPPAHYIPDTGYPDAIKQRPLRWLERQAVEDGLLTATLTRLRAWLGEAGYYWLSACAIYPAVDFRLAVHLGAVLRGDTNTPLLNQSRLQALSALPWFRQGTMPDWLRNRLVSDLPRYQEAEARKALDNLLLSALEDNREGFELDIANTRTNGLRGLAQKLMAKLSRQASSVSPLRDKVFVGFMRGPGVGVRVGRWFQGLLISEPKRIDVFNIRSVIIRQRLVSTLWLNVIVVLWFSLTFILAEFDYVGVNKIAAIILSDDFAFVSLTLFLANNYVHVFISRIIAVNKLFYSGLIVWVFFVWVLFAVFSIKSDVFNHDLLARFFSIPSILILYLIPTALCYKNYKKNLLLSITERFQVFCRYSTNIYASFFKSSYWLLLVTVFFTIQADKFVYLSITIFLLSFSPIINYLNNLFSLLVISYVVRKQKFIIFTALHHAIPLLVILYIIFIGAMDYRLFLLIFLCLVLIHLLSRMRKQALLELGIRP